MDKLLIVDGSNLLFQMFFGMPSRIVNRDGKAIQGTLGFVGALLKIINMTRPTHLAVLFDGEHENSRTGLDPDYKANRVDYSTVPEEENPFSQLGDIYDALDFMGVRHSETTDCEGDDVIAGYVFAHRQDMEIVISSFDSDFFQLIDGKVSVLRYRGSKSVICDAMYVQERYGVLPSQYADFKSLTGDTSDNIRGAEKVGLKTAAALINQFGNLRGVLENADSITKPSVRESILRCGERLHNNYKLIKLGEGAALPFDLDELVFSYEGRSTEVLKGIHLL